MTIAERITPAACRHDDTGRPICAGDVLERCADCGEWVRRFPSQTVGPTGPAHYQQTFNLWLSGPLSRSRIEYRPRSW